MACGSGGTTAGIALGAALCPGLGRPTVSAYGVCDSPEYFYEFVGSILSDMNAPVEDVIGRVLMPGIKERVGGVLRCVQAKGTGYAMATEEELGTTAAVAKATGVLLDPVYSGKAVHGLLREMAEDPGAWDGRVVLFVHTGGALGMYDKLDQLRPIMETIGPSRGYDFTELDTA
jgi:1-aminocyclopropane-1-carboxylate deaminase/D-cysteine desulfhydrase-like pyridoxal-dependent ACC family enzyme